MKTRLLLLVAALIGGGVIYFLRGDPTVNERDGRYYDAIEDDPNIQPILRKAETEAREEVFREFPHLKGQVGFEKMVIWGKKRILKEKYGIEWRTPMELNPGIAYG